MKKIALLTVMGLFASEAALADHAQKHAVKVQTKGGLKVSTTDGNYSVKVGGRIQWDYNNAKANDVTDEDGFDVRRARLFVSGKIQDWSFKSQFNVNGNGFEDLYIRYNGWGKQARVTIGNQKMPFGLEELASSKDISLLERSAITERYAVGRQQGVQLHGGDGHINYGIGLFEDGDSSESGDLGFAARVAYAPINEKGSVLHFGLAYTDRADESSALGLEAAWVAGAFHAQAEYVSGEQANADDLSGYYLQLGWVVTGESRAYKGGKFKRIKPAGKSGAWELVARYESGDGNYSDIELGNDDATALGLGINWYTNKNVRFGLNYTTGDSETNNDEGEELRLRTQIVF